MNEFNRPPRIRKVISLRTLTAPTPPDLPPNPGEVNWVGIGLPILGVGLAIFFAFAVSGSSTGNSFLLFIPFMLAGILVPPITNYVKSKKYNKALQVEKPRFKIRVDDFIALLEDSKQKEINERLELDPSLGTCMEMVEHKDIHLGERRPTEENPDYLSFRLGLGEQKASIEIRGLSEFKEDDPFSESLNIIANASKDILLKKCPINSSLLKVGSLGIAGSSQNTHDFCRSSILHISTHHWPSEVQFVVICPNNQVSEWDWINSLPHRVGFLEEPIISISSTEQESFSLLENEIRHRQDISSTKKDASANKPIVSNLPLPSVIVIVDHISNPYEYPAIVRILKENKESGVFGLFICDNESEIPGECGGMFLIDGSKSTYKEVGVEGISINPIDFDHLDLADAIKFSKQLSNINWLIPNDVTDPPQLVTLLELFDAPRVEDLKIAKRWDGQDKNNYLKAPIGRFMPSHSGDLFLDLKDNDLAHGPHGIISGMTGSGKSELLKTLVLSLAVCNHPYDLNFVLVDYKGGAAFSDLEDLPHVIAVVTDIETHANYAERLLLALIGELNKRMQTLIQANEQYGLNNLHIDDYRALKIKEPMPRLVIIFDEFAEFKDHHPEQSEQLVSIARRGRSLGVHLILCTQNPSMVINQQIKQNSRFRICLNVSSSDESRAMIGTPNAWRLPRGRAFLMVDQPIKFQVAYSGRKYLDSNTMVIPENVIYEIKPDGSRSVVYPTNDELCKDGQTECKAIVDQILVETKNLNLKAPDPLLPEPLEEQIYLPELIAKNNIQAWNGKEWPKNNGELGQPILGVIDKPYSHDQPVFKFDPQNTSGNLLIFGSSGSGKSTALRTLVSSITTLQSPLNAQVFVLNLGNDPGWELFKELPHIGAIVNRDEIEKGNRLLFMLRQKMIERFEIFKRVPVDELSKYNELESSSKLPEIYLLIDGLTERLSQSWNELVETLSEMVRDCRSAGIFIIITANNMRDIPSAVYTNIEDRISFRQVERTQLETILGAVPENALRNEVGNPCPPGRGLVRGDQVIDFQAALPGLGSTSEEQIKYLKSLFNSIKNNPGINFPKEDLESLANHYSLDEIRDLNDKAKPNQRISIGEIPIGIRYDNKMPIGINFLYDGPTFLIGSQNSKLGKTSTIQSWVLSLAESFTSDEVQFVFIDFHSRRLSAFRDLPHTLEYVRFKSKVSNVFDRLKQLFEQRQVLMEKAYEANIEHFDDISYLKKMPLIILVIDDFDGFRGRFSSEISVYSKLSNCLIEGEDVGLRLILAENLAMLASPQSDPVLKRVVRHGCGISIGGSENIGTFFNNVVIPRTQQKSNLPEGRGFLVKRGQANLVQTGVFWDYSQEPGQILMDRVMNIKKQSKRIAKWPKGI